MIPNTLATRLTYLLVVTGICLLAVNAIILSTRPNGLDALMASTDRTPPVYSLRYTENILGVVTGLALVVGSNWIVQRAIPRLISPIVRLPNWWKSLPRYAQRGLMLFFVLSISFANSARVMDVPFTFDEQWDEWAGAWTDARERILQNLFGGLEAGCLLCTADFQPLENTTEGDDLGLHFLYGWLYRLGMPATLAGYQQMTAALVGFSFGLGAAVVAWGYRSWLAGVVFGLLMTLFSTLPSMQSILITAYWVPGAAGVLVAAFILATMARMKEKGSRFLIVLFFLWGLVAGGAYISRSNAGVSTLLAAGVMLLVLTMRYRHYRPSLLALMALVIGLAIPLLAFRFTLSWRYREHQLSARSEATVISHGFSHGLYLALGYVENRWDIRYLDSVGSVAAQRECPGVVYLSAAYYGCIRDAFIHTVVADPDLLIRNLLAKTEALLQVTFSRIPFVLFLPLFFLIVRQRLTYLIFAILLAIFLLPGYGQLPFYAYIQGYGEIIIGFMVAGLVGLLSEIRDALTSAPS